MYGLITLAVYAGTILVDLYKVIPFCWGVIEPIATVAFYIAVFLFMGAYYIAIGAMYVGVYVGVPSYAIYYLLTL